MHERLKIPTLIDLGNFTAMAKVKINGKYAGGLWTPPYQLDISDLVMPGENELEIEIVNTWVNRIENFKTGKSKDNNYQVSRAKTAIVSGKIFGLGAGKSRMKNFLPQSSSDFIYAIIVEEFGLVGGIMLILIYLLLLFRIVVILYKTSSLFGKLTVIGLGIPIIFQAFINIGVSLQVLPVTGQNLPMISSGGTSAWMTCIAMGIILSVSAKNEVRYEENLNENNPLNVLSETI